MTYRYSPDGNMSGKAGLTVYVVCRIHSNEGPYSVFPDGYTKPDHEYECDCGNLAEISGHFTNRRHAARHARELNAKEAQGDYSDSANCSQL